MRVEGEGETKVDIEMEAEAEPKSGEDDEFVSNINKGVEINDTLVDDSDYNEN